MRDYKKYRAGDRDEETKPEPRIFTPCGMCYGNGVVSAVKSGIGESFICPCPNGNIKNPDIGSTGNWAVWGESFKSQGWKLKIKKQIKNSIVTRETTTEYQTKAKELLRKACEGTGDLLAYADELFEMDRLHTGEGWFETACFFLKKFYLLKGYSENDIETAMPKECF